MTITFIGNQKQAISDAFAGECQVWTVAEALAREQWPALVKLVNDTVTQEEFDAVLARTKKLGIEFEMVNLQQIAPQVPPEPAVSRPALDEPLVAADDERRSPTLAWYTQLLNYALGPEQSDRCCVLWGPPGVGKTLATERIEETLHRRREQSGMAGRRLNGTTTGVPELRHYSFADAEDGSDMTTMVRDIKLYCVSAVPGSIVIVDDVDVLPNGSLLRSQLFKALSETLMSRTKTNRCRVIVVLEDYWAQENSELRKSLESRFFNIYVGNANMSSLVAFMHKHFPALDNRVLERIAHESHGDVRAALCTARLTLAGGGTLEWSERDGVDQNRQRGSLTTTLASTLRSRDPTATARSVFCDHNTETAAELLFANCPRFLSYASDDPSRQLRDLETLATTAEYASLACVVDQSRRENFFSGADGTNVDKDILFSLQVEGPVSTLSRALHGESRRYTTTPQFELPLLTVRKSVQQTNEALAFYTRHELVDHWRREATIQTDLEIKRIEADVRVSSRSTSIALRLADTSSVLVGRLYKRALHDLWCERLRRLASSACSIFQHFHTRCKRSRGW